MSIAQNFKSLQESLQLDKINVQRLSDSLMKFKRFTKQQISGNQNTFRKHFQKIAPKLLDHINTQKQRLNDSNLKLIAASLRAFKQVIPSSFNIFNKRLMQQINVTTRQLIKNAQQIQKSNIQQQKDVKLSNKIIQSLSKSDQSLSKLNLKTQNQRKFETIQGQLQPIQAILRLKLPQPFNAQNLPSSVAYLNKYAMIQGYKPVGSISNLPGRAYIGRTQIKDGIHQYIIPYPKNQIGSGQTPNILNNYRYFAGRTINAWNQFVQAENKLVNFVQKIQTEDKRKQFVAQQLKQMTVGTFCAQILSTLTYYYLFVPLQNFMKFNHNDYNGSRQSFLQRYNVANQLSKNPLLLRSQDGKWIAQQLITTIDPVALWNRILNNNRFTGMKNAMNRLNFETLTNYYQFKLAEAKTFFNSMGTMQQAYRVALQSHKIVNIKKRKFVIPSMFSNPQILQMLNKISKRQQNTDQLWELSWGSDKIMCHDYVWQYKL